MRANLSTRVEDLIQRSAGRPAGPGRCLTSERALPYNRRYFVKSQIKKRSVVDQVSELTTNRLSIYVRCLDHLASSGVRTVSSQSLANQFRLNAAQIRKDLAWFGEFGVRGVGYSVSGLAAHLRQILGIGDPINVAVIGAGNLGQALADYPVFPRHGFMPVALFDRAPGKVGTTSRGGVPILHIRRLPAVVRKESIRIAMIAVPPSAAQQVASFAVAAGLEAILNFAPGSVAVPAGVKVKNVDLTISLEGLAFHLANSGHGKAK
jgi:redox-sensing transcriptional repressor